MADRFRFFEVKRVFLACPGDLVTERSRFPKLLETINNLRAHSLGFHFEPVGWERVIPSFGRPQELINRELESADLVIVMFWNRIGSPSDLSNTRTGTLEEFELARTLHQSVGKPLVWVYFRRTTDTDGDQITGVNDFRKALEQGKDIFFREYSDVSDWEEMLLLHLVAYLDGLVRWQIEINRESMRPEKALLLGSFTAEGVSEFGSELVFSVDLDGDGFDETIRFKIDGHGYWLDVFRHSAGLSLSAEGWINPRNYSDDGSYSTLLPPNHIVHIAFKDVTNDGLPEIIVAAHDGAAYLRIIVWGFKDSRVLRFEDNCFTVLGLLEGQSNAWVYNGGRLRLPFGTAGRYSDYVWSGAKFEESDGLGPGSVIIPKDS